MSRFFHQKSSIAGFEELISERQREKALETDYRQYEAGKIYTYLENNYYRLKKIIDFMHRKIYLLHHSVSHQKEFKHQVEQRKKKINTDLMEELANNCPSFQKRLAHLFNQFNHE